MKMIIKTTWGDKHYVGLNGIEVFQSDGQLASVTEVCYIKVIFLLVYSGCLIILEQYVTQIFFHALCVGNLLCKIDLITTLLSNISMFLWW